MIVGRLVVLGVVCLGGTAARAQAVLYSNGPLSTGATLSGTGETAPAGTTWSELQTGLSLNTLGFGCQVSANIRCADDFVVPAGQTWVVTSVAVYGYQTGAASPPAASTINAATLQIWSGTPGSGAVVFGDTTTNRLAASADGLIYRSVSTGANLQRYEWRNEITVDPPLMLTEGTYWIDFDLGGTLASGPWAPPVTILGETGKAGANGMQSINGAAWTVAADTGGTAAPQDFVFEVMGGPRPAGQVALDSAVYGCDGTMQIAVADSSLQGSGVTSVTVASTSETTPEVLQLAETPADSGLFVGSITLTTAAPANGDGLLSVSAGDTITVVYVDADDGMGGTNLDRIATATVDCTAPVITDVQVAAGVTTATFTWDTDEPADSVVDYGTTPPTWTSAADAASVTSHSIDADSLTACTTYYFQVTSTDPSGNSTTDDDGGAWYYFNTLGPVAQSLPSADTPMAITDAGTIQSVIAVAATGPVVDVNVTVNITHTNDADLVLYLMEPMGSYIELATNRGDTGDNYTNTVFDDQATISIADGSAPFTGSFIPEEPLATFNGLSATGNWSLYVTDLTGGEVGTLDSWTLELAVPGPCGAIANGQTCTGGAASCLSGFCSDGVCCDTRCGDSNPDDCQGCATGTCSELTGQTCRAATGECDVAEVCQAGQIACPNDGVQTVNTACTADLNPCTLDICDGATKACTHPAGNAGTECRGVAGVCDVAELCTGSSIDCPDDAFASAATECRAASCATGTATLAATCTGADAACPALATAACSPYVCGADACLTACATGADCATDYYCAGDDTCQPKQAPGQSCSDAAACLSDFCVDGVCCDVACAGQCQACDVAAHVGTCTTVPSGAPHGSRAACGGTGVCQGSCDGTSATACGMPGAETECAGAACAAGEASAAAVCDGSGACGTAATTDCGAYACGATACNTSCATVADCATGYTCVGGVCQLPVQADGGLPGADGGQSGADGGLPGADGGQSGADGGQSGADGGPGNQGSDAGCGCRTTDSRPGPLAALLLFGLALPLLRRRRR